MAQPIGQLERVRALAVSGRLLAVGGIRTAPASTLSLYDWIAGKPAASVDLPAHVLAIAGGPTGFAVGCADGSLRRYDPSGVELSAVSVAGGACNAVTMVEAAAGRPATTLVASADGRVRWFTDDGRLTQVKEVAVSSQPLRAIAADPATGAVATGGDDGVVRVVSANGAVREMPGHDGPVLCLAFTPAGDRVLSGGEDGTLRTWFLVGPVEADVRGDRDTGHPGGALAVLFLPGATEVGSERFVSAGQDGTIRVWRLGEKRRPKTFDGSKAVAALAFATTSGGGGALFSGGDARTVKAYSFDAGSNPIDRAPAAYGHGFDVFAEALKAPAVPRRIETVTALAGLDEPDALALAISALNNDRDATVRTHAATSLAARGRVGALDALRSRLDDAHPGVRSAAFAALRQLQPQAPLSPIRAALGSGAADVRKAAVEALPGLASASPLVGGILVGSLRDADAGVRRAAFAGVVTMEGRGSPAPLRAAVTYGTADIRAEAFALVVAESKTADPAFAPVVERALDDDDAAVRRVAYTAIALTRPVLADWLVANDEGFARSLDDLARRVAVAGMGRDATDAEVTTTRAALAATAASGTPAERDREPLLAALACRTPDTALRGARGLALLGDMRALGALLNLSREPDASLRREVATALASLDDPRARRRIAWLLDDGEASVRDVALQCLGKLEPAPLDLATHALRSSQQDIRTRGLSVLVEHGKGTERGNDLLGDALDDEAAKVRSEAFRTYWAWHQGDPLAAIDRALTARFPDVRRRAIEELTALAKPTDGPLRGVAIERLLATIADRDEGVATAAFTAARDLRGEADPEAYLRAMANVQAPVRATGASGSAKSSAIAVRDVLVTLLQDDVATVRRAAIDALDRLFPTDATPIRAGLATSHLEIRIRAAEILAERRDNALVDPMLKILRDENLVRVHGPELAAQFRRGAATAIATLGSHALLHVYADDLVPDDDGIVREQGSRGLANACHREDAQLLVGLLGHADIAVRSWVAEGLARLGDARGVPVLVGTLRHQHPPIRIGAVLSFASLIPPREEAAAEGFGGLLQGLEDPSPAVQRIVLSVLIARDLAAFRRGEPPELLSAALASARPEVRFAAARALELRTDPGAYLAHLIELLLPDRPEKAADMATWPDEDDRARRMVALAAALAGDASEQRYAALQALRLRDRPLVYFREAARVGRPATTDAPWVPETTPRAGVPASGPDPVQRLRRLFAGLGASPPREATTDEEQHLFRVAFGAYVGLLRQVTDDDESHRVRRDAVDRIADLVAAGRMARASAVPALARAFDDPNHLVRRQAFAALKRLYPEDPETPLSLALLSTTADVLRGALDDLAAGGNASFDRIASALDSPVSEARKYAFDLLEQIAPKGSVEPLLAALRSQHADLRLGVLERLATSRDPRVAAALERALVSDHEDLRLRAAEILASHGSDRAVDVLDAGLRAESSSVANRSRAALAELGTAATVRVIAGRLGEETTEGERLALVNTLGRYARSAGRREAVDALVGRFADDAAQVRHAAWSAAMAIAGPREDVTAPRGTPATPARDPALTLVAIGAAVRAKDPELRRMAAKELDVLADPAANALLVSLFTDRDRAVRVTAVDAYALRVEDAGADPAPLDDVLRTGNRETMLGAAYGLAVRKVGTAFRPLLLFVRAGEPGDRERALLGLGTLGDLRALTEVEEIAAGGTEEAPVDPPMRYAAVEALGLLYGAIVDTDARERVRDRIEASLADRRLSTAAIKALVHTGGERARARLEAVLAADHSPWADKVEAAIGLGTLGDVSSEDVLAGALNQWIEDARWAAYEALIELFPNDRTRVELHAVVCGQSDLAEQAADYLIEQGSTQALLTVLGTVDDDALRERMRAGLVNRDHLPSSELVNLLTTGNAVARSDAAWLAAARIARITEADRAQIGAALVQAARIAERNHEAHRLGNQDDEQQAEATAWVNAMWAARRVSPAAAREDAPRVCALVNAPAAVRVQAAHALAGGVAAAALAAPELAVRFAAASAVGPAAVLAKPGAPEDPVALARSALAAELPSGALSTAVGRRGLVPVALRTGKLDELLELARSGSGDDRLDAIAALGRSGRPEATELLSELCQSEDEPEPLRQAAYRAARRSQRFGRPRTEESVR